MNELKDCCNQPENKTEFSRVQVGDKVWDIEYGWGTVDVIYRNGVEIAYFTVRFEMCNRIGRYTIQGREYCIDTPRRLFWNSIVFPLRPPRKVKKEKVLYANVYKTSYGSYITGQTALYVDEDCAKTCGGANIILGEYIGTFPITIIEEVEE